MQWAWFVKGRVAAVSIPWRRTTSSIFCSSGCKWLICHGFFTNPEFLWITLLISTPCRPPGPANSCFWVCCPAKGQLRDGHMNQALARSRKKRAVAKTALLDFLTMHRLCAQPRRFSAPRVLERVYDLFGLEKIVNTFLVSLSGEAHANGCARFPPAPPHARAG